MNEEGVVVLEPLLTLEALRVAVLLVGGGSLVRGRRRFRGTAGRGGGGGPAGSADGGPRLEDFGEGLPPAIPAFPDNLSIFLSRVVGVRHAATLTRDGFLYQRRTGVLVLVVCMGLINEFCVFATKQTAEGMYRIILKATPLFSLRFLGIIYAMPALLNLR